LKKIIHFFSKIYRVSLNFKKQEALAWRDLKQIHLRAEWKSGIYEKERYIETAFEISNGKGALFHYFIAEGSFHCRGRLIEKFPAELTTDVFVLASHFNNLLSNGVVKIDVNTQSVDYYQKTDLLVPLLYKGEYHNQISVHFNTSLDIYAAFNRLVIEQEAPAIIIADLLKSKENNDRKNA
jgi:hypothetical protein